MDARVNHADGIITITDSNTTIAYCRYDGSGEIEYLFVSPPFRRHGCANRMLDLVEERLGTPLRFNPPISPLGRHVVESYGRRCTSVGKDVRVETSCRAASDGRATASWT